MKLSSIRAILIGLVLIAILTPTAQFLTVATVNSDLETATPVGWAVGLILSMVIVLAVVRAISRYRLVSKSSLVIIFAMLTIAVPMMNIGLVRMFVAFGKVTMRECVSNSNNTYRTAYLNEKPEWFPVVPTCEGLAWNKAERLLRILQDAKVVKKREQSKRQVTLALSAEAQKLGEAGAGYAPPPPEKIESIRKGIEGLGLDEVSAILKQAEATGSQTNDFQRIVVALGLMENLQQKRASAEKASAEAAERLMRRIGEFDEREACYSPVAKGERSRNVTVRFVRALRYLSPAEQAELDKKVARISAEFPALRADVLALGQVDYIKVRNHRAGQYRTMFQGLDAATLAQIRADFLLRSSSEERSEIYGQNGTFDRPNQNLEASDRDGVFMSGAIAQRLNVGATPWEQFREKMAIAPAVIPWHLWVAPMLRWGGLFLLIFLFFMCLAEWLRRKWVEQENLAFPLVEIADNIIRHDYELEGAEDVVHPRERSGLFSPLFWVGVVIGGLMIMVEALGTYNMTSSVKLVSFDLSDMFFTSGMMKELTGIVFVISPIVVGILFLVSLEVSLSIWVLYLVYRFVALFLKQSIQAQTGTEIRDSIYTGWGGGVNYPFEGEQLLGASLCLAAILLFKAWHSSRVGKKKGFVDAGTESYVPRRLNMIGLIAVPLVLWLLLRDLGIANGLFLLMVGVIATGLAIAAARVRAETGLPTQHTTYEFTKLPLVFGMTGWLGARAYTLFVTVAYIPMTLLFRLLPQQLENIELARRNGVNYRTIAVASLVAFAAAVGIGMVSLLFINYYLGATALGAGASQCSRSINDIAGYPLWVSHFLGEAGLESFTQVHWVRVWAILAGIAIFGILMFLRQRVMKFPIHPIGYILILLSTYFNWISPYFKSPMASGPEGREVSWIWGSALVAWLIKKLVVKYGGMNTYRRLKPLFIGLVVGAIFCVFAWNVTDLVASIQQRFLPAGTEPNEFMKYFLNKSVYNPRAY